MNPAWQQKKLREFCKEKGIVVLAYSPLAAIGTPWGSNIVMDNDFLKEIAEAHGKSVAQVITFIYLLSIIMNFVTRVNRNRPLSTVLPNKVI